MYDKKYSLRILVSAVLITILLATIVGYIAFSSPSPGRNIYLDDIPSTATYTIYTDGTEYWAVRHDGKIPSGMSGIDDDAVIQYAIDNCTSAGGTVFVKTGSYSANIAAKNNLILVIERGATGITISIDSGATCWVVDYNAGRTRFYSAGTLVWDEDYAAGKIITTDIKFTGQFWFGDNNRTTFIAYPPCIGTSNVNNNGWISHTLGAIPTIVLLTGRNATYDTVAVVWSCVDRNSTHFQVGLYWTNSTAITAALTVDWYAEYKP